MDGAEKQDRRREERQKALEGEIGRDKVAQEKRRRDTESFGRRDRKRQAAQEKRRGRERNRKVREKRDRKLCDRKRQRIRD